MVFVVPAGGLVTCGTWQAAAVPPGGSAYRQHKHRWAYLQQQYRQQQHRRRRQHFVHLEGSSSASIKPPRLPYRVARACATAGCTAGLGKGRRGGQQAPRHQAGGQAV